MAVQKTKSDRDEFQHARFAARRQLLRQLRRLYSVVPG